MGPPRPIDCHLGTKWGRLDRRPEEDLRPAQEPFRPVQEHLRLKERLQADTGPSQIKNGLPGNTRPFQVDRALLTRRGPRSSTRADLPGLSLAVAALSTVISASI